MRYLITFFLVLILFWGCKKEDSTPVTPVQDSPTVKIVNPVNNQNILDSVTIQIAASDPKGVTKVELFIQNNKVKEFAIEPYTYFWDVKSLHDSSQYSIYAKAHNSDDKVTGSEVIKVTINRLSPSNLQILSLTKDTVHLKWEDNSVVEESYVIQVSTDSVSFTSIAELPANTTEAVISYSFSFGVKYYFRIGAKKNNNVSYSSVLSGGARPDTPLLLSPENNATEQSLNPVLIWNSSGGAASYTLQLSTSSNFTSFLYNQSGLTGTSQQISGLSPSTRYHFRVRATNSYGTSNWSTIWKFKTGIVPAVPTLSSPANNATDQSVNPTLSWITSSGATNYTLQVSLYNNFIDFVYIQSGLTDTSQQISGLSHLTQYYWRVSATNSYGTSDWSTNWSFKTKEAEPCPGTPTVTYAGKTYNTVVIGNQCWLKENLDVGTMILGSQDQTNNSIIEKYCYDDLESNCDIYGGLYQWNEAMQYTITAGTQGVCPSCWHFPTNSELQSLASAFGNDGNILKEIGQGIGGGAGTNTSGFSALLAGYSKGYGVFSGLGSITYFWSSTVHDVAVAHYLSLNNNNGNVSFNRTNKGLGFSVRCVQD